MKKLIVLFLAALLLFAAAACAQQQTEVEKPRAEFTVVYDKEITKELLGYFMANQYCVVTGVQLTKDADLSAITDAVALLKDEAAIEQLKAMGWTEAEYWTDAQKEKNAEMFNMTVLNAPKITDPAKTGGAILSGWLVGEAEWDATYKHTAGGCSCKPVEKTVRMQSDAPLLVQSEEFEELTNP